jgi:hypothetical protein
VAGGCQIVDLRQLGEGDLEMLGGESAEHEHEVVQFLLRSASMPFVIHFEDDENGG